VPSLPPLSPLSESPDSPPSLRLSDSSGPSDSSRSSRSSHSSAPARSPQSSQPTVPGRRLGQILLVKTSSLGDVVHNLPVIDDLRAAHPGVAIDWLVEHSFAEVPALHPQVRTVIGCALRRWRTAPWAAGTRSEWRLMRAQLAATRYDLVIDSQGLLKSALLACLAHGPRAGFDRASAREPLASRFYQHRYAVAAGGHAVERNRQLVALAAHYPVTGEAGYGTRLGAAALPAAWDAAQPYAVLLHATARAQKLWPDARWIELAQALRQQLGLRALFPWGSPAERARSERLAQAVPQAQVPERSGLRLLAHGLALARVVIGVDTGLLHLASAVGAPCIGLYVATDPARNGLYPPRVGVNLGGPGRSPEVAEVLATAVRLGAAAAIAGDRA
jgi:heptosyltransferase I